MKWLIINTESFSLAGVKNRVAINSRGKAVRQDVSFTDLPCVVRKFLSAFPKPFIVLDESSKIKSNVPMEENDKSTRTRLIKLLSKFGDRMIMTATVMSKSPLNVIDQYDFLREGYFPENMYEFAERYCVMVTIRVGRGRRVLISKKDYAAVRKRLVNAYQKGGEARLKAARESIYKQYTIDYAKQEHIIKHKEYTPFLNEVELIKRIAPDTMFVKRKDVFDISFEKFVHEPIMRPVELSAQAKKVGNELVKIGFTDKLTLGRAPALELMVRLQDICNGFEPVRNANTGMLSYEPFKENPKINELMELLEEIDAYNNQCVVWSSRKLLVRACADAFTRAGISFSVYDGDTKESDKKEAERKFTNREVQILLANQASGGYGLDFLGDCDYSIALCVDESVEKFYQMQHRILRGQLRAPKFMYAIYVKGSVEEKQWDSLRVGKDLLSAENNKDVFKFA